MLFRTLVHRNGPRATHLIACRASRAAVLVDPHPDDSDRYSMVLEDLELRLRAVVRTTPGGGAVASDLGSYRALLDDLGLELAATGGTSDLSTLGGVVIAPVAAEAGGVRLRAGERELLLSRPTGARARVARLEGPAPRDDDPWDCAVLPLGDLQVELWASPGEGDDVLVVLPDRALVPDVGRLAEALGRLPAEVGPALGIRPWSLLFGSGPMRGPLPITPPAPRPVARRSSWSGSGESRAAGDEDRSPLHDTRWSELGAPHPDGYRQIHPLDASNYLDRMLIVEVAAGAERHLPGTCAVDGVGPAALVASLDGADREQAVLLVSEYGYDCRPFARQLVRGGFRRVFHLKGGLHRWRQNELPTVACVGRLAPFVAHCVPAGA